MLYGVTGSGLSIYVGFDVASQYVNWLVILVLQCSFGYGSAILCFSLYWLCDGYFSMAFMLEKWFIWLLVMCQTCYDYAYWCARLLQFENGLYVLWTDSIKPHCWLVMHGLFLDADLWISDGYVLTSYGHTIGCPDHALGLHCSLWFQVCMVWLLTSHHALFIYFFALWLNPLLQLGSDYVPLTCEWMYHSFGSHVQL